MNNAFKTLFFALFGIVLVILFFGMKFGYKPDQSNIYQAPISETSTLKTYASSTLGFSIAYPKEFTLDEKYQYQALGPGKEINGIKFTIPESFATGTNLSRDSYVSVEYLPQVKTCDVKLFLDSSMGGKSQIVNDKNVTYEFASSTDAAVGNRYEESVYVIQNTNQCLAVRYFIHYGVFENYPEGTITKFDDKKLKDIFDGIRQSLQVSLL